ncbi:hypothetical protein [Okeania sp. SIO2B3]|uniref:hypothetical protein n=1 Tax=Okeania sp. SIO2B3 TaxID=2607784 RepID=UPI0013C1C0B5|nr:hypothetical protein [Okeania sp. SIO2B3]NET43959.1 hypothetical protein [Okeania sp. SIO2B3]
MIFLFKEVFFPRSPDNVGIFNEVRSQKSEVNPPLTPPRRQGQFIVIREKLMGRMGRWGDGEMGRWGDGEMGRWGDGEMGRWGDGEICTIKCISY